MGQIPHLCPVCLLRRQPNWHQRPHVGTTWPFTPPWSCTHRAPASLARRSHTTALPPHAFPGPLRAVWSGSRMEYPIALNVRWGYTARVISLFLLMRTVAHGSGQQPNPMDSSGLYKSRLRNTLSNVRNHDQGSDERKTERGRRWALAAWARRFGSRRAAMGRRRTAIPQSRCTRRSIYL